MTLCPLEQGGKGKGLKLTIHVEGPFGIPSVDFENSKVYNTFMLVTGGIGVTPAQSIFNHLVHQYCEGRDIRKCVYLWSVKDRAMIESIDEARTSTNALDGAASELLPQSFQPNLLAFSPRGNAKGGKSDVEAPNPNPPLDPNPSRVIPTDASVGDGYELVPVGAVNANTALGVAREESFSWDQESIGSRDPFHVEFNLTSCRNKEDFARANINPETQPYLKFGRPDLPAKWQAVAEMCVKEGIPVVAVLVCGPAAMVEQVQGLCSSPVCVTTKNQAGEQVTGSVRFELHMEEFDF